MYAEETSSNQNVRKIESNAYKIPSLVVFEKKSEFELNSLGTYHGF